MINRSGDSHQPRYNWSTDINHWKVDGLIPLGRCYHCGFRYNNFSKYSAFCGVCHREMHMGMMEKWEEHLIETRTRIPEETIEADFKKANGTNI